MNIRKFLSKSEYHIALNHLSEMEICGIRAGICGPGLVKKFWQQEAAEQKQFLNGYLWALCSQGVITAEETAALCKEVQELCREYQKEEQQWHSLR